MSSIGIDALSFYVPNLYLPIEALAEARDIPYVKLNKGLGLASMALPDLNEDAASFAANALLRLIEDYKLDPREIGRIYLGTESAVDGSKPTATYAMQYVEQHLESKFGARSFKNCDCVDLTFACIGAVDAFQNCLDWVAAGSNRKAVVIASDLSKYDLHSTGEYTQGAGAVAVLLSENPSLVTVENTWGIGMQSVGDFFKPRRLYSKSQLLKEAQPDNSQQPKGDFWNSSEATIAVYKEMPVFDGQYSNACYSDRVTEAIAHYNEQTQTNFIKEADYLVFHLPYAYHGRRIVFKNWLDSIGGANTLAALEAEVGPVEDSKDWMRAASKSETYRSFVNKKIELTERGSSQIGNMYTASIFMALSSLLWNLKDSENSPQASLGFIAYGSGSKSKVFKGQLAANWQNNLKGISLQDAINQRRAVDVATYEALHNGTQQSPVDAISNSIVLKDIETQEQTRLGLRTYGI